MKLLVVPLVALGLVLMSSQVALAGQSRSTERPYDPNAPIPGLGDTDADVSAAYLRATPEERRADAARTTELNLGVLTQDRRIEATNADAQTRYRQALADYERRRNHWQADVAACTAGDRARCSGSTSR